MKKKFFVFILVAAAGFSLQACMGSYAVGPPPMYPNETITIAPSPIHVWVPGRYVYRNSRYDWSPGYHQVPPHGRTQYRAGSWNQSPKGYRYQKGNWH